MNDYGFELLSAQPFDWETLIAEKLFSPDNLEHDILVCEPERAGVVGAPVQGNRARVEADLSGAYGTAEKRAAQLQASSGLFYEVFRKHDSGNLLLTQADQEVMLQELELGRIRAAL